MVKEAKDELVEYALAPRCFIENLLRGYIDSMPIDPDYEFWAKSLMGDLSIIEMALAKIEKIYGKAQKGQLSIYKMCGVCPEWWATEQVCQGVRELIVMIEDILCLALQGPSTLVEALFLGELAYQKYK